MHIAVLIKSRSFCFSFPLRQCAGSGRCDSSPCVSVALLWRVASASEAVVEVVGSSWLLAAFVFPVWLLGWLSILSSQPLSFSLPWLSLSSLIPCLSNFLCCISFFLISSHGLKGFCCTRPDLKLFPRSCSDFTNFSRPRLDMSTGSFSSTSLWTTEPSISSRVSTNSARWSFKSFTSCWCWSHHVNRRPKSMDIWWRWQAAAWPRSRWTPRKNLLVFTWHSGVWRVWSSNPEK